MSAKPQKLEPGRVLEIALDKLKPDPKQPRKSYDKGKLDELAESIRKQGVLQPILVRIDGAHMFIVAGERRWRASKLAKRKTIPCLLAADTTSADVGRAAAQLTENLHREALNPIEIAEFLADLQTREKKSTNELLGALTKMGVPNVSHARIDKLLQFTQLPDWTKKMLREGDLAETHAVHLLSVLKFPALLESVRESIEQKIRFAGAVTVKDAQHAIEHAYHDAGIDLNARWPEDKVRAFSIDVCKGCEFKKVVGRTTWCLNPDDFKKKQNEALDLKAQRAAAAAERKASKGEDRDNPDPTQVKPRKLKLSAGGVVATRHLQYDVHKDLAEGGFDVAGCEGCPHKHLASHNGDKEGATEHCFHLPCYSVKQRAGRRIELHSEKLEGYLDAWLRPWMLGHAPGRATANLVDGLVLWLSLGALSHTSRHYAYQKHETAAQKTRALVSKWKVRSLVDVAALGGKLSEEQRADLVRCAIATMDAPQLRWFARELHVELLAEGWGLDMAYLNLQRKAQLLKLAEIGKLEHARGSVQELKDRILNSPGSVDHIGVPEDLAQLYAKPYALERDELDDPGDEDYDDPLLDVNDEQLAAALAGSTITAPGDAEGDEHGLTVCIGCGCTDVEPCEPPCSWIRTDVSEGMNVGVCSDPGCKKDAKRFDKGDRKLSKRAKAVVDERAELGGPR